MSIVNSLGTTTLYEYHTCPKCGSANLDVDHSTVYTSYPPCYRYTCRDCGYVGFTSNFADVCEVSKPKDDKTKSDCEKCQNKDICKYKERFEKFMKSPDPYADDLDFVEVIIKCKYYKEELQLVGKQILKITTPGEIRLDSKDIANTTNHCLRCEHYNKPYHSVLNPCLGCPYNKNTLGYTITPNGTDDIGKVLRVNGNSIEFENADGTITTRTYTNKENTESE